MKQAEHKVCSKCGENKQANEFYGSKGHRGGLHPWCKPCVSAYGKARRGVYSAVTPPDTKMCTRCNIEKSSDEFNSDSSKKDGLQAWCKACMSAYSAARRKANAGAIPPEKKFCPKCGTERSPSEFYIDRGSKDGLTHHCKFCVMAHYAYLRDSFSYAIIPATKLCTRCQTELPAHEFYVCRESKDGLSSRCKVCSKALSRAWKERNEEWCKKYDRENSESRALREAKRRALKRQTQIEPITVEDLEALMTKQDGRCAYCETKLDSSRHIEHMTPLSRGGTHTISNIALACPKCNFAKGTRTAEEFMGEHLEDAEVTLEQVYT